MARVLVTGMSGAGKSTLLGSLSARGYLAIDTDYDGWEGPGSRWDEPRMDRLLADHSTLVVSGTAENQGRFYDRFEHVVYLHAPLAVLLERVASRPNNPFGRTPRNPPTRARGGAAHSSGGDVRARWPTTGGRAHRCRGEAPPRGRRVMSAWGEITLWRGNLTDADAGRRVLVLPGSGYSVDLPGLQLPMRALALAGWQIWAASWDVREVRDRAAAEAVVVGAAEQFIAQVGGAPQLVLAKSLGTMAAAWVADHDVPAVWTTPLLIDQKCVADITRGAAPALLLAGSQDHTWDDDAARRTGKPVRLIAGADHAWQTGDWREEIDVLRHLVATVEEFADALD